MKANESRYIIQYCLAKLKRIPIAWLQLKYQWRQTLAGIAGILCVTFLLFLQLGLRNAFLEGALQLPLSFNADIVIASSLSSTILQPVSFPLSSLYRALALQNVNSIAPIYITSTQWYDEPKSLYRIRVNVIGIPLNTQALNLQGIKENLPKLSRQGFALFDRNARHEFSSIIQQVNQKGESSELIQAGGGIALRQLRVVGLFELGVNNAYDATFITSPNTFSDLFKREEKSVDIGLIKLKPGQNSDVVEKTVEVLRSYLPGHIQVSG